MARPHRPWLPGTVYHISNRGNKKAAIFCDDNDNQKYLDILAETNELYPFKLHSYCLMYNHFHLLLETHDIPISTIMKNINFRYAIYFNKKYDQTGHVFQGRFHSEVITDAEYFLNASRYIHLNPLEAEVITQLEDYPWSSYSSYFSSVQNPLVTTTRVLFYFQEPQIENYLEFLMAPNNKGGVPCL